MSAHVSPLPGQTPAKPLVSVIIPTRNRAECLPRALDSIYAQAGRGQDFDLEVIVVDDASSDDTPHVVEGYPEVRYIRLPEPRGVSAATNVALRVSRGCYIAFLDDDDVWLEHKLSVQVPLLKAHPEIGVLYSQSIMRSEGTEELYPDATQAPSGRVFEEMLIDNFAGHHASHLIRRSAFEKAGYFDETLRSNVDYEMSLRLAFHVSFLFVPGAVDVYNVSPKGLWLTRAASGMGKADVAYVIESALRLLPDSPQYEELKQLATARANFMAVYPLLIAGELEQARTTLVTALRTHPWLLGYDWTRATLAHVAGRVALAAASPVSSIREFCAAVRDATLDCEANDRRYLRKALAAIWTGAALSLAADGAAHDRESAHAAAVAIATVPSLIRRPALLRLLVRGVFGRGVDGVCVRSYGRLRKMTGAADRSATAVPLQRYVASGTSSRGRRASTGAASHGEH